MKERFPVIARAWVPRIVRSGMFLKNRRTKGGIPLDTREAVAIRMCDGANTRGEIDAETARLYGGATIDWEKLAPALEYRDAECDPKAAAPQLGTFDAMLDRQTGEWKFYPLREEAISTVSFTLTRMCNHLCTYCFQGEGHWEDDRLSTDIWESAFRQFLDMGMQELTITGGEAVMHPALWRLMELAHTHGVFVTLQTNGTLFTPDDVDRLCDLGLDYVYFSLPSIDEATYDTVTRTTGDLPHALASLAHFKRRGCYARVKSVITIENGDPNDVKALLRWCYAHDVEQVHLAPFMLTYIGGKAHMPSRQALEAVSNAADELREECAGMTIACPGESLYRWADTSCIARCGGVKDNLKVMPNGDITFCESLSLTGRYIFGNITTDRIEDIWLSDAPDKANIAENIDPRCQACEYVRGCNTGCLLSAYLDSGNPWGMDPMCFKSTSRLYRD